MIRRIITIDEEKCNGCGLCADACHEGAIGILNGKAKLQREDYCDGLGDCLPACPTGAISFEEREAPAYDAAAVEQAKKEKSGKSCSGCPGTQTQCLEQAPVLEGNMPVKSRLAQWPVQIKLVPVNAPYFDEADLLIAADCTAFTCGCVHERFIKGRTTLIACPKLDKVNYAEKLAAIFAANDIRSITVLRMQVPCCGGLENAAKRALLHSGKFIPWQVVTISTDGRILD